MSAMSIIYVLSRADAIRHNLTKVGSTKISTDSRAANYTDGGWIKYFDIEVSSHIQFAVERTAHRILRDKGHWLDPRATDGTAQEIFTCGPEEGKQAIIDAVDKVKFDLGRFIYPQTDQLFREIARLRDDKRRLEERLEAALSFRSEASSNALTKAHYQLAESRAESEKKIRSMQLRINELEFYIEGTGANLPEIGSRTRKRR